MPNPGRDLIRLRWPDRLTPRQTTYAIDRLLAAGWTRKQIATACGVTVNAVCQWIHGQRRGPKTLTEIK